MEPLTRRLCGMYSDLLCLIHNCKMEMDSLEDTSCQMTLKDLEDNVAGKSLLVL